ncbi:hypothetical protein IWZ01DRAFT_540889 [Phyllosticta capitalensis]
MDEQPPAKRARLQSLPEDSPLNKTRESEGFAKDKHHLVPKTKASMSSEMSNGAGVSPSPSNDPENSLEVQKASSQSKESTFTKATNNLTPTPPLSSEANMPPWRTLALYTQPPPPGWTRRLSPSFSPTHSTPPEVSKWAQSTAIKRSLYNERDDIQSGRCVSLQRAAPVSSALCYTNDFYFPGFVFPYGAWGFKRPLPNNFLPRRPKDKQRSKLHIITTPESLTN